MALNLDALKKILNVVTQTQDNELNCDECMAQLDQFAEVQLERKDIPEALRLVEAHIKLCPECQEELALLLDAIRALEGGNDKA